MQILRQIELWPRYFASFQTDLSCLLKGLDELAIQIFSAIFDNAARASTSLRNSLAKHFVAINLKEILRLRFAKQTDDLRTCTLIHGYTTLIAWALL